MAKEKRSAADLDAELAALEAELAALDGKPKKAPKAKAAAPAPARSTSPAQDAEAPAAPKKGRFSMPFGRKGAAEPAAAPEPAPAPAAAPAAPEPAPPIARAAPAPLPTYDGSLWEHDGDAWVRRVPETPVPIIRRLLDEEGNVLREEPATARELEEATGVKAERGIGRLLRRK